MLQPLNRRCSQLNLTISRAEFFKELYRQWLHVTRPLTQRQNRQLESTDTEIQVFAELAIVNGFAQIFIGRSNESYIQLHRTMTTEAGDLALL